MFGPTRLPVWLGLFLAIIMTGLAIPAEATERFAYGFAIGAAYAVFIGALFAWAFGAGNAVLATMLATFGLAYAPGLGTAAANGVRGLWVEAGPESVLLALVLQAGFLGTICAVTHRLRTRRQPLQEPPSLPFVFSASTVLAVSFAAALAAGSWTYYGSAAAEVKDASVRLDFLYLPALFSSIVLTATRLADPNRRAPLALWGVLAAEYGLLFLMQQRRLMAFAAILAVVLLLSSRRAVRIGPRGMVGLAIAILCAGWLAAVGSEAWRESSGAFQTNDPIERLLDASRRATDFELARTSIEKRLTYLWLDSVAVENAPALAGMITLEDEFTSAVWGALPGKLAPDKYSVSAVSCEGPLASVGLRDIDLPCTALADGYLAAGAWGVLLLGACWGAALAFIETAMRWGRWGVLLAAHLAFPMSIIETSAFPMVSSVRVAGLGLLATAALCWLWHAFLGAGFSGKRPHRIYRIRSKASLN